MTTSSLLLTCPLKLCRVVRKSLICIPSVSNEYLLTFIQQERKISMLTLLGSLLGFIGSLIPEFFKFFREKADRGHELNILDRQMELWKIQHTHRLEEIRGFGHIMEDIAEIRALYAYPPVV